MSADEAKITALGVVNKLDGDLLLLPDGLPDLVYGGLVGLRPLKESATTSKISLHRLTD